MKAVKKPELLSPAGNWSSLKTAVSSGADSVYFGVKSLNMRDKADNFDILEIKKVMDYLHKNKKKGYLALNIIVMNNEIYKVRRILEESKKAEVDAVILWDMAVLSMVKELDMRVHLSTQASVSNIESLKFFTKLGVKRIVLARECNLKDIKEMVNRIDKENIDCEIETFIHGAMCVSISGRCLLSEYSFGKSANRGKCLQPCRREYIIKDVQDGMEYVLGKNYILSPKDLCTIDFIDDLIKSGVSAFKIEGRMRPSEYIKIVTLSYRKAIDSFFENKLTTDLKNDLKQDLKEVYNRGFSAGFYLGTPGKKAISKQLEHLYKKIFVGEVKKFYKKISVAEVLIQNGSLIKGDKLLFAGKKTQAEFSTVKEMQKNNEFIDQAKKGDFIGIKLPFRVRRNDKVFLWKKK